MVEIPNNAQNAQARYVSAVDGRMGTGPKSARKSRMASDNTLSAVRPRLRNVTFGLWREVLSSTFSLYAEGGGRGFGSHMMEEARFLPPMGTQPGSMMTVSRSHGNSNSHYLDFNDSPLDPPGPARPEWQKYVGEYDVMWEDLLASTATVTTRNGYLYFRDGKCREHEPGLFFLYDGEALDFRSTPPTFASQLIRKHE